MNENSLKSTRKRAPIAAVRARGTAYLMVLATCVLVTVMGVSSVMAMRVYQKTANLQADGIGARLNALAGVETVARMMKADPNWRTNNPSGTWGTSVAVGTGSMTYSVTDAVDGVLSNSNCDPVVVRSYGFQGKARSIVELTLKPDPAFTTGYRTAVMGLHPVAYWPLRETSGTTAADVMGVSNGTYKNGVTLNVAAPDCCDVSPQFDGVNDLVTIPHTSDMLLDSGTVAFWFRTASSNTTQGLFSKFMTASLTGGNFEVRLNGGTFVKVTLAGALSTNTMTGSTSIAANTWYHVATTFGASGMKLYINGLLVGSNAYTGGWGVTSGGSGNTRPITLGATTTLATALLPDLFDNPLNGRMSKVAIFNYALNSTQVLALKNAGLPTRTMKIVPGSWKQIVE
jgi:hypothetical protein